MSALSTPRWSQMTTQPFVRASDPYRRLTSVWRAGNTIGRAAKKWLGKRKGVSFKRSTNKRQRMMNAVGRGLASRHNPAPRIQSGMQVAEGHGHSMSNVFLGASPAPYNLSGTLRGLAEQRYVNTPAGVQQTCAVGVQSVFCPSVAAAGFVDVVAMSTAASVWNNAANTTLTADASKWFLESFTGSYEFTNASAGAVVADIYDCVARRDVNTSNLVVPSLAWKTGLSDEGGSASSYTQIGSVPFESDMFTQFWKVVKKTRIILASGEAHRHLFSMKPNQLLHQEYVNQYGSAGVYRDLSYFPMVVFHGMPAHDSTTKTSVSTGAVNLDSVYSVSYSYKILQTAIVNWYHTNNLASSFAVGQEEFNEAVGQQQNAAGLTPGVLVD